MPPQWCSEAASSFAPTHADLAANAAMAQAVAGMFRGPTVAYGAVAGQRPGDAAVVAKWRERQAAAEAARLAAEAALDARAAADTAHCASACSAG